MAEKQNIDTIELCGYYKDLLIKNYGFIKASLDMPDLLEIQLNSYEDFLQADVPPEKRKNIGLQSVFQDSFPVISASNDIILEFVSYSIGKCDKDPFECKMHSLSYASSLKVTLRLVLQETGEVREQEVYLGELPLMTSAGSFIYNGTERVVVNQLHRSPGIFVFYTAAKNVYIARIIPDQKGSWLEFEMDEKGLLVARIDRKKKFPFTVLVKALGYNSNEEVLRLFYESEKIVLKNTSAKDLQKYLKRRVIGDVQDPKTDEILIEAGSTLNEDNLDIIISEKVEFIELLVPKGLKDDTSVVYSLEKDDSANTEEALLSFLKVQRPLEYTVDKGNSEKENVI